MAHLILTDHEWNLICIAHNLKVMWEKLKENVGVLCENWGSVGKVGGFPGF
jgi:hypothetical protein